MRTRKKGERRDNTSRRSLEDIEGLQGPGHPHPLSNTKAFHLWECKFWLHGGGPRQGPTWRRPGFVPHRVGGWRRGLAENRPKGGVLTCVLAKAAGWDNSG